MTKKTKKIIAIAKKAPPIIGYCNRYLKTRCLAMNFCINGFGFADIKLLI